MLNKNLNQLNNKFLDTCKLTKAIEEKVNSINFVTTKMKLFINTINNLFTKTRLSHPNKHT